MLTMTVWSPTHTLAQEDTKFSVEDPSDFIFKGVYRAAEVRAAGPQGYHSSSLTYTESVTAARVAPRATPMRFLNLILQSITACLSFDTCLSKTLNFLASTRIYDPLVCSNRPGEVVCAVCRTLGFNASLEAGSRSKSDKLSEAWRKIFALRSDISKLVSVTKGPFYRWIVTGSWLRRALGPFYDLRATSASEEKLVADWPGRELVSSLGRIPGEEVTAELALEHVRVGQSSDLMPLDLGSRTALYDIQAHTVYMPNGERLEAHSGIGKRLDDPRYVHERNRGATPPHIYDLALRRRPFHGVAALRLRPVGDGNMFGRAGMLAHSYMLGARGDSHGCVVFKDYPSFLQAFRSGEVLRLVVVRRLADAKGASVRNRPGLPSDNVRATGIAAAPPPVN